VAAPPNGLSRDLAKDSILTPQIGGRLGPRGKRTLVELARALLLSGANAEI